MRFLRTLLVLAMVASFAGCSESSPRERERTPKEELLESVSVQLLFQHWANRLQRSRHCPKNATSWEETELPSGSFGAELHALCLAFNEAEREIDVLLPYWQSGARPQVFEFQVYLSTPGVDDEHYERLPVAPFRSLEACAAVEQSVRQARVGTISCGPWPLGAPAA